MSTSVKAIPDGYQAVIPYLVVKDAAALIGFARTVFGAEEKLCMLNPDGTVGHADLRIHGCVVMISEATAKYPPMPCMLYIYMEDLDGTYQRAMANGAVSLREPEDQFYGDRTAGFVDMCGNQWWLGKHVEDVTTEELQRRHSAARGGH